jgi:transposase-like protein
MAKKLRDLDELFKGRHVGRELIILCVRRYCRFKLSYRDLVEMMVERGLHVAHTTIMRLVQRYVPEFEKRWARYARKAGRSWRIDETCVKVLGRWAYLYRAVDRDGDTVDFRLSPKRDVAAAKAFLRKALRTQAGSHQNHARWLRGITSGSARTARRKSRVAQHEAPLVQTI